MMVENLRNEASICQHIKFEQQNIFKDYLGKEFGDIGNFIYGNILREISKDKDNSYFVVVVLDKEYLKLFIDNILIEKYKK